MQWRIKFDTTKLQKQQQLCIEFRIQDFCFFVFYFLEDEGNSNFIEFFFLPKMLPVWWGEGGASVCFIYVDFFLINKTFKKAWTCGIFTLIKLNSILFYRNAMFCCFWVFFVCTVQWSHEVCAKQCMQKKMWNFTEEEGGLWCVIKYN